MTEFQFILSFRSSLQLISIWQNLVIVVVVARSNIHMSSSGGSSRAFHPSIMIPEIPALAQARMAVDRTIQLLQDYGSSGKHFPPRDQVENMCAAELDRNDY